MGAAVRPNIDHIPAVDILIDFAGMFPILEGFRRWAVLLSVSLLENQLWKPRPSVRGRSFAVPTQWHLNNYWS
jgi:hypothetical protein